ncbi:hypothetical protein E4U42_002801 [Claviceps africana]|uniref:Uncharacterized protein n=1 Tax=Claviceps africana TaxID=83212 RepID=A0A8K0J866_9HYPO|nr:hypothetical protein E4U42_002801 [Claviceps africana]
MTTRGDLALSNTEEYLPSHLFPAVTENRWVKGRGTLILVFNPEADDNTIPYWEWTSVDVDSEWQLVPAGHKIKVLHAWVKISTSAQG